MQGQRGLGDAVHVGYSTGGGEVGCVRVAPSLHPSEWPVRRAGEEDAMKCNACGETSCGCDKGGKCTCGKDCSCAKKKPPVPAK